MEKYRFTLATEEGVWGSMEHYAELGITFR